MGEFDNVADPFSDEFSSVSDPFSLSSGLVEPRSNSMKAVASLNNAVVPSGQLGDVINTSMTPELQERERAKRFYSIRNNGGEELSDIDLDAFLQTESGTNIIPSAKLINEQNAKPLKYRQMAGAKQPRMSFSNAYQLHAGKVNEAVFGGIAGLFQISTDIQAPLDKALQFAANKSADGLGDKLLARKNDFEKTIYNGIKKYGEENANLWTSHIDPEIKNSMAGQIAAGTGELPMLALYAIPGVGPAMTLGRYKDEGYSEAIANGKSEQQADLISYGYMGLFGTIGVAVDKLTLGAGSKALKNITPKNLKSSILKQAGIVGIESQVAGFSELLTETAESASLQYATKGTVDMKQAAYEGFLAYITGSIGSVGMGGARVGDATSSAKRLVDLGLTEDEATAFVNDENRDPKEALSVILERQGERVERFANPQNDIKLPTEEVPWTLGEVEGVRKSSEGDELNQVIEAMDPAVQDVARRAFESPTESNVDSMNKAIERVSMGYQADGVVDAEVELNEDESFGPADVSDAEIDSDSDMWFHGTHEKIEELSSRSVETVDSIGTWATGKKSNTRKLYGENSYRLDHNPSNLLKAHTSNFKEFFYSNKNLFTSLFPNEPLSKLDRFDEAGLQKTDPNIWEMRKTYLSAFRKMLTDAGYEGIVWKDSRIDLSKEDEPHDVAVFFNTSPIKVSDAEQVATDLETFPSIYEEMSLDDISEYISDLSMIGVDIPQEIIKEAQSRINDPAGWQMFQQTTMQRATVKKKNFTPVSDTETSIEAMGIGSFEVISDQAARFMDSGASEFTKALDNLEFNLIPKNADHYQEWAEKNADEYGTTVEHELNILKVGKPKQRRNQLAKLFWPAVSSSNEAEIYRLAKAEGLNPDGSFIRGVLAASGQYSFANAIANKDNRVELTAPDIASDSQAYESESQADLSRTDEAQIEDQSETLQRLETRANILFDEYAESTSLDLLSDLSSDEMKRVMMYAASKTQYDNDVEVISYESLPAKVKEFFAEDAPWDVVQVEIAERLNYIKEALGMDFEALHGYYFPMKHSFDNSTKFTTVNDMFEASIGSTMRRSGGYEGVIEDPKAQMEHYLRSMSRLMAIAEETMETRVLATADVNSIAEAVGKRDRGEVLSPKDEQSLETLNKLSELDKQGAEIGIPASPQSNLDFYRSVDMLNRDGGGRELPSLADFFKGNSESFLKSFIDKHGRDWINLVDAAPVTVKMDGITEVTQDGRHYGANARFYDRHIRAAMSNKQANDKFIQQQKQMIHDYFGAKIVSKKNLDKVNKLLMDNLIKSESMRKEIYSARNFNQVSWNISEKDAKLVWWYSQQMKQLRNDIALAPDLSTELQKISTQDRIRFHELERKVQEGVATTEEQAEYMKYAPKSRNKESKKVMARNVARAIFEKQAMDSGDFLGYFQSFSSIRNKGVLMGETYTETHLWADYLESKGQPDNAKWWRNRAEYSIKGEMFKFEDDLLTLVAEQAGKKSADSVTHDMIKAKMVDAINILQKARINAFLAGNLGWTFTTQPSSLAFTIKQTGFKNTGKALYDVLFGATDISDSQVTALKSSMKGLRDIESIGEFQTERISETKRQKLRNYAGIISSEMEAYVTGASYLAGYNDAKDRLKMSDEEARIHGDFTAATTQSMYDKATRNTALNSNLLRLFKPMQSYVFTAFSQALDTMGAVGRTRPKIERARELARWVLAQRLYALLWSLFWGDDLKKAIFDPTYDKGTLGSNIPVFGSEIDIQMTKIIPWKEDQSWRQASAPVQFAQQSYRIAKALVNQDEHAGRETLKYLFQYATPMAGIPATVPLKNMVTMHSAHSEGSFEDITGKTYANLSDHPDPLRWAGGVLFGIKAADESEADKKRRLSKRKKRRNRQ